MSNLKTLQSNSYENHISDEENEFMCKTAPMRKVTNFIEKNAYRFVYTERALCSIT